MCSQKNKKIKISQITDLAWSEKKVLWFACIFNKKRWIFQVWHFLFGTGVSKSDAGYVSKLLDNNIFYGFLKVPSRSSIFWTSWKMIKTLPKTMWQWKDVLTVYSSCLIATSCINLLFWALSSASRCLWKIISTFWMILITPWWKERLW